DLPRDFERERKQVALRLREQAVLLGAHLPHRFGKRGRRGREVFLDAPRRVLSPRPLPVAPPLLEAELRPLLPPPRKALARPRCTPPFLLRSKPALLPLPVRLAPQGRRFLLRAREHPAHLAFRLRPAVADP